MGVAPDMLDELDTALREALALDRRQRHDAVQALDAWVRSRSVVPYTDERLWSLLKVLPAFVDALGLHLSEKGLHVEVEGAQNFRQVALILERGSTWLRGGEWREVVLACVSRESSSPK